MSGLEHHPSTSKPQFGMRSFGSTLGPSVLPSDRTSGADSTIGCGVVRHLRSKIAIIDREFEGAPTNSFDGSGVKTLDQAQGHVSLELRLIRPPVSHETSTNAVG